MSSSFPVFPLLCHIFLTLVFWGTFLHLLDSEAVKIDIRVGRLKPGLLHSSQVVNDQNTEDAKTTIKQ